jgi:hypothetical protein
LEEEESDELNAAISFSESPKGRFLMTHYKWTEVYKVALFETDWTKMQERIQAAEAALLNGSTSSL